MRGLQGFGLPARERAREGGVGRPIPAAYESGSGITW
jgi:hypothetical protein